MTPLVLLYAFLLCLPPPSLASDILKIGESIRDGADVSANLVTAGNKFELGFFSPARTKNKYLGIWYYEKERAVVWVANRDNPIPDSTTGIFQISLDGNLSVSDTDGNLYWSYRPEKVSSLANLTVKLMDSGNLILGDDQLQVIYWQSFQHPTDTFLVGMRMDQGLVLNSWRAPDDPGSGNFTFARGKTGDSNYTIYENQSQVYWAAERRQDFGPGEKILFPSIYKNKSISTLSTLSSFESARLVMNHTGHIRALALG